MPGNTLYIVVPCYNEEEVLPETARRLGDKLRALMKVGKIGPCSRVLFVNDGSKDKTWEIIQRLHREDGLMCGVDLTRNRGHQNALLAGLMTAKDRADMVISMDADLQDDVDAADAMVDKYLNGVDIVYGVRSSRKKDTFFKRTTAEGFYRMMDLLGAETVFNHADYRLMSKRALEGLAQFTEVNLFIMILYNVVRWATGNTVAGWASLACSVWFIGGLILLSLGVIGEYLGKLYLESKDRPRFLIREVLDRETDQKDGK